jgi:hypothetical protein
MVVGALDPRLTPGVYNLGAGRSWTIRSLAELVQDRVEASCGWRPPIEAPPALEAPTEPYVVVPEKLAAAGLRATTPLAEAVDELVDHCKQHDAALRGLSDLTRK